MFDLDFILTSLGFIVPVILVIIIITQGYVKAPPDHAYIISGLRKQPRVLIGRAGIKIPFLSSWINCTLDRLQWISRPMNTSQPTISSMLWWMRLPRYGWLTTTNG